MVRTLLTDPDTLSLDESFAEVNSALEKKLLEHVHELREQDYMFLFAEHDTGLIMNSCERVIVLRQDSVLTEGTPDKIWSSEEVIEAYLRDNV